MAARVLLVDDDSLVLRTLYEGLVLLGEHNVTTAGDGLLALQLIRHERPEVIVLDMMMPGMNGLEVVEHLRADKDLCNIPVIMLTACTSDTEIWNGWRSGIDSYLPKPLDFFTLLDEIERVTNKVSVAEVEVAR